MCVSPRRPVTKGSTPPSRATHQFGSWVHPLSLQPRRPWALWMLVPLPEKGEVCVGARGGGHLRTRQARNRPRIHAIPRGMKDGISAFPPFLCWGPLSYVYTFWAAFPFPLLSSSSLPPSSLLRFALLWPQPLRCECPLASVSRQNSVAAR